MLTRDQERARFAWEATSGGEDEYVKLIKGVPAMIMGNGLMQALAFYEHKDAHGKTVVQHICRWLREREIVKEAEFSAVMESLYGCESDDYMRATEEALEIAKWIRHLAGLGRRAG